MVVYTNNFESAYLLVKSEELIKFNVKAYVTKIYIYVTGVMGNVDLDIDLTDLKEEINLNYKCVEVSRMQKLNKELNENCKSNKRICSNCGDS